ncbi:MAG: hypothetical protein A2X08_11550 [Bacteroidetes bacterium GWA2_32_17]|nr:MAG: hypothetical protein A2X08_11550 [Bacteroidetes bacterium GWA2_32_17]
MDYSVIYFDKSLNDLKYEDIENFFLEAKEESTKIEFKAFSTEYGNFEKNLEKVVRGICAFLNSEGGILIWGAPKGIQKPGKKIKTFEGALSPLKELKEKDWIINKVSDLITPLPVGIKVAILQNKENIVYVFEVQQSNYSPHQFSNTYWARLDGQTKPAPHYLIDALFRKIKYPNIEGFIKLEKISNVSSNYNLAISILLFNFSHLINEENVSFRVVCTQGRFSNWSPMSSSISNMYQRNGHLLVFKDFIDLLHSGQPNVHHETLVFNPHELATKYNNCVDILLTFGGKYSPLKLSKYKLDFNKINWDKADEPNYLFLEIEENSLSADVQTDRETILKEVLKR